MPITRPSPRDVAAARRLLAEDRKAKRQERGPKLARTDTGKADRGRVRDNPYLAYLRRQPCCVGPILRDGCNGPTDPAHLRFTDRSVGRVNPGLARKSDDRWCLPVCRKHHEAQHAYGNEARWWSAVVGVDPNALAIKFYEAFQREGVAA